MAVVSQKQALNLLGLFVSSCVQWFQKSVDLAELMAEFMSFADNDLPAALAKKPVWSRESSTSTEAPEDMSPKSPCSLSLENIAEDLLKNEVGADTPCPEFDIAFVGYGFTSLGIAWALKQKDASLKMAFVSLDEKPGGLWWDASDNVKLHIPTYRFALPGLPHDQPECHTDSRHQASSEQVRQYAAKIADRVTSAHFVGEVVNVSQEGKLKKVSYAPKGAKADRAHLLCRHVVQATGFDGYGGKPHLLGVPLEVHSSQLRKQAESLRGKRVLLVGSGKSSIDAAHLLIQQQNTVRCLYRSPTAYTRRSFNSPLSSLVMFFHPHRHFTLLEAEVTAEDWKKEAELDDLDSWDWYVVGNPDCEKVREKTRGGIVPLSDFLLMNLMLHAYGVQGDASRVKFTENTDGTVSCEAFPGEKFDCVVSCTGYKGSSKLLPHCINATTPISDLHIHQAHMTGCLLHSFMDDDAKVASWNALASHKSEYQWHQRYAHVRKWCSKHAYDVIIEARRELNESMRSECQVLGKDGGVKMPPWYSLMIVSALEMLEQVLVSSCKVAIRLMWFAAPPCLSRALLRLAGVFRKQ